MSYGRLLVALVVCAAGAETYAQSAAPRYRVERVPTEDPSCSLSPGVAFDLNDAGAVIGQRCIDDRLLAFIAHKGNLTLLPQDKQGTAEQLRLNDRFDLILSVSTQQEGERNLLVPNDGIAAQINPLKGDFDLSLIGLNNRRQVLAWSVGASHPSGRQSMIWQNGRATPLGMLPDSFSSTAVGLNDHGVAIGYNSSSPGEVNADQRAVLWERDTVMPLPLPGEAIGSRGRDINNRGQAVLSVYFEAGTCHSGSQRAAQTFLWQQGSLKPLPLLPIGVDDYSLSAHAADINNAGVVVGSTGHRNCFQPDPILRATVWRGGAVYELEKLLVNRRGEPVTSLRLQRALSINDTGQILVEEFSHFIDAPKYFVLTPVN
jgi:uncharacterized membrane protein